MNQDELQIQTIVEGILYVVGEDGISLHKLSETLSCEENEALALLENIQERYEDPSFGIRLVHYGESYKFVSKEEISPYLKKLFSINKPDALSQSALETLAIIAYKQPVTRVEIEELRGVSAETMLRKLLSRNLIREAGRLEEAGRPILYEITEEFMDSFSLLSLQELPDLPDYSAQTESEDLFK